MWEGRRSRLMTNINHCFNYPNNALSTQVPPKAGGVLAASPFPLVCHLWGEGAGRWMRFVERWRDKKVADEKI